MQFGYFSLVQKRNPEVSSAEVFQNLLMEVKLAEDVGMDLALFAEHHFSNYGLSVSPLLTAGWIAAQTRHIRLAPGVLVLPLYNPLRLIQEFEMLNLMTGNRIEFGFGTGYQKYEFERYGVELSEGGDRTVEVLDMYHQAVDRGRIEYRGKYYNVPDTAIAVRAHAQPPTIFAAAALSHPLIPRLVVRRGYVPLVQAGWKPFEQVMNHRSFYDEIAAQEHVRPESIAFGVMRFVHVSDSRSDWLAAAEAYRYSTRVATSTRFNYAVFDNNTGRDIPAKDEPSLEEIIENCVIGTADACIEKVAREIRACRASHYVCMMNCGGLDPAKVKKSLELMGREVIPEVKRRLSRKTVRVSPAA